MQGPRAQGTSPAGWGPSLRPGDAMVHPRPGRPSPASLPRLRPSTPSAGMNRPHPAALARGAPCRPLGTTPLTPEPGAQAVGGACQGPSAGLQPVLPEGALADGASFCERPPGGPQPQATLETTPGFGHGSASPEKSCLLLARQRHTASGPFVRKQQTLRTAGHRDGRPGPAGMGLPPCSGRVVPGAVRDG